MRRCANQRAFASRKSSGACLARGLSTSERQRLKELERENARLKRLVADQALDNAILKEVAEGNF